jgi:hypothetical protein
MRVPKDAARGRVALRDRLEWLLVAIQSGKYGEAVDTANQQFAADYVAAMNAPCIGQHGKGRPRWLGSDLTELHERGHLTRESVGARRRNPGGATFRYAYRLTATGASEAQTIAARTEESIEA